MIRRIVWVAVLLVAVATLGGAWFVTYYERVPYKTREAPGAEARRNPLLALERFFTRMGRPIKRESDARLLDAPPPGSVLILDRNRRHHMTPQRTEHLLAWVEAGGYLILVPEYPSVSDPICDELDIGSFEQEENFSDEEADDEGALLKSGDEHRKRPKTIAVEIPGAKRPLTVRYSYWGRAAGEDMEPDWSAGDADFGDQILHYDIGEGHVTVIDGLTRLLNNDNIGDHDHAELIWTLVQTYQPDAGQPVTMMSKFAIPTLWDWLAGPAWAATISGLALLGLWLWRILPRFGPPMPEPDAGRRELREHLAALGRYVWCAGGLDHWLAVAREEFLARLALRHPALMALAPDEQAVELAKMSDRPASLIAKALHGQVGSPHSFTQAMRILRNLERIL